MEQVVINVAGIAAGMGSKRIFHYGGRPVIGDDNGKKRRAWANAVRAEAAAAMQGRDLLTMPVGLFVVFRFTRPAGHFGTGRNHDQLRASAPIEHAQSPDLDKLLRCVGDALTSIVYRDDRQVCHITASREWTLGPAGASIVVTPIVPVTEGVE